MDIRDVLAGRASINDLLGTSNALNNLTSGPLLPTAQAPIGSTAGAISDTSNNLLNTDYGRYARSLLNSVALGIPKWALDKTGVGSKISEATGLQYNPQGQAEKLGELIGTIIPLDTVGKGLQVGGKVIAKGAKSLLGITEKLPEVAKSGKGIINALAQNPENMWGLGEKAANLLAKRAKEGKKGSEFLSNTVGRILPGAVAGALPSMAEQGIRSFTAGQSLPEALQGIATAGAVGGLTGGVLGKLSKEARPRLADLEKEATSATVGKVSQAKARILKSALPYYGGGSQAGGFGKAKAADELMNDVADITNKLKLDVPGKLDDILAKHSETWKQVAKAADDALPEKDAVALLEKFAPEGLKDSDEIYKVLKNIPKKAQGLDQLKTALYDTKAQTYNDVLFPNPADARAMQDFVNQTAENINNHMVKAAEAAKIPLPEGIDNWTDFRKSYKVLEPLGRGEALSTISPLKFNLGSPTAEKLLAEAAATGEESSKNLLGKVLVGIPGGKAIQGALQKTMGSAVGAARPLIQAANKADLGGKIEKLAPEVAAFSGNVAGKIANANAGTLPLQSNAPALNEAQSSSNAPEVAAAQGKTQGMAYQQRIDDALKQRYEMFIKPQRPDIPYEMFYNYMKAKTYNFNPQLSGGILSFDPEYKKSYSKTAELAKKIEGSIGEASKRGKVGAFGLGVETGGQEAEAAYAMLEGVLSDYIKSQGVSDKKAKELISKAAGKGSLDQKRANIYKLLAQFGANQDALTDMGVI